MVSWRSPMLRRSATQTPIVTSGTGRSRKKLGHANQRAATSGWVSGVEALIRPMPTATRIARVKA